VAEDSDAPAIVPDDVIPQAEQKPAIVEEPESLIAEPEPVAEPEPEPEAQVEEPPSEEAEEDDEEARKKRVAEKLARMGGINPFTMPPIRRPSSDIATSPPARKSSSDIASPTSPPPPPGRKPTLPPTPGSPKPASLRRTSGGSIKSFESSGAPIRRASVGSVGAVAGADEGAGVGRRASVGSVRSVTREAAREESVQEIVEEPESLVDDEKDGKY
jgi:hypothetical protein